MKLDLEAIFDGSYERVMTGQREDRSFIYAFYERFIEADPRVREKFAKTDMTKQVAMLEKSLHYLAYLFSTQEIYAYIESTARIHGKDQHDIPAELYDVWLEQLIATVAEFDEKFDRKVELAWRLALARGIAYMKFMYTD